MEKFTSILCLFVCFSFATGTECHGILRYIWKNLRVFFVLDYSSLFVCLFECLGTLQYVRKCVLSGVRGPRRRGGRCRSGALVLFLFLCFNIFGSTALCTSRRGEKESCDWCRCGRCRCGGVECGVGVCGVVGAFAARSVWLSC